MDKIMIDRQYVPKRSKADGVLGEFIKALEAEIETIEKNGLSSTLLFGGRKIENAGAESWYRFNVEYMPVMPADTPCKLIIGKEQVNVTVIGVEENAVTVASKDPLPPMLGQVRLENGTAVLMERLIRCIEDEADMPNDIGRRMLLQNGEVYTARKICDCNDLVWDKKNTERQNEAITAALTNDITYIWGPPGTGKTTVIGQIVDELYKRGRSVLIVSHTNTAVDGVIEKADKTYTKLHADSEEIYPILRIGTPSANLPERVSLTSHVVELGKELSIQKRTLEEEQKRLEDRFNAVCVMFAKEKWVRENSLSQIEEAVYGIDKAEKQIERIQDDVDKIDKRIIQAKKRHPMWYRYAGLSKAIEAKQAQYEQVHNRVIEEVSKIEAFAARVEKACDERKKHDKYKELREQESKLMSMQFFQEELKKTGGRISDLVAEIDSLEVEQKQAERTIAEYGTKGLFAKLFGGRSAMKHAQARLMEIGVQLPQKKEELYSKQQLKQRYEEEKESLRFLQEQIKAMIPSKTKEYWDSTICQMQTVYVDMKKAFLSIDEQEKRLLAELETIKGQQDQMKGMFTELWALEAERNTKKEYIQQIEAEYSVEKNRCEALLRQESACCAAFLYYPKSSKATMLFGELSKLLQDVKKQVQDIDINLLKYEKTQIEKGLSSICNEISEIEEKMSELEAKAIENARVIGTTLAKSYLSESLRARRFDTIILDEASMASVPALWCASRLAENSVVIVGDFLQLSPIVMAKTPIAQKWLGKDIFYHSGMMERAINRDTCPANFVMLNDQFRMESDIADIANVYYGKYGGLRSNDASEFRVKERERFYDWYSGKRTRSNIHLIDTESLCAWVTGIPKGKGHSRLNSFSALIDVELAFKFIENKLNELDPMSAEPTKETSVLIVTPYAPHAKLLKKLIDLEYLNRGFKENLNYIKAGTVHSFQGGEADIVIFDLVIDAPHWKANLFMVEKDLNDGLRKMFNVAVTRAKFKLYIVGNFAYCQKRAKNNALSELLEQLFEKKHLAKIEAKRLLPDITYTKAMSVSMNERIGGKHIGCRDVDFDRYFTADIRDFQKRMIIYSPFITVNRLSRLLPAFVDAIKDGKQIIVVTKDLTERGKKELAQYQQCEQKLRDIGITVFHKKGMHEKLIFIDDFVFWSGSLNVLSFTGSTGEVMHRFADKEIFGEYEKLYNIKSIWSAVQNSYEQKCPVCRKEMAIRERDRGGIYWRCMECGYSRKVEEQYPIDGVLRCECGAPYVFFMKNEPRWICTENRKHYRKMNESDLKLEKMAALITKKSDRKRVDDYFAKKK